MAFQSTFPRGERLDMKRDLSKTYGISIHVPAWGTTHFRCNVWNIFTISIHVPAWGTTPAAFVAVIAFVTISIHVPAWGTTALWMIKMMRTIDFNPRSRVGNDNNNRATKRTAIYFNPRSRVGNDRCKRHCYCHDKFISIHVPAWGTTTACIFVKTTSSLISIHVPAWGTTLYQ